MVGKLHTAMHHVSQDVTYIASSFPKAMIHFEGQAMHGRQTGTFVVAECRIGMLVCQNLPYDFLQTNLTAENPLMHTYSPDVK